jgi:uncharacterized protein YndB with AHSA1/START domain
MTSVTKTRTITVERTILAPREEVFAWLSTGTNYTASPLVFTAKLVRAGKDAPWGLGARRQFATAVAWFDEEIVAFDAPSSFEYRIVASVPPIDHVLGLVELHEVPGGTRVVWTSTFRIRIPAVGGALGAVAVPVVSRAFAGVLTAAERSLTA